MTAILHDIMIEQGNSFELVVEVRKDGVLLDITGYTGTMQVRPTSSSSTILATATVSVNGPAGIVVATIPKATTAGYTWTSGVYDLQIDNGSISYRVAKGYASLSKEVTH